jgi:DNA invertase Pin-like site-specific DNA recombinase
MINTTQKPAQAIIFAKEQKETGYFLETQVCRLQEYCKRNGLEVIYKLRFCGDWIINDYQTFLATIYFAQEQTNPIVFVCDTLESLPRNYSNIHDMNSIINAEKLSIHCVREGVILDKQTNATVNHGFSLTIANCYKIQNKSAADIQLKLEAGEWIDYAPVGYLSVRDTKGNVDVVVDEEKRAPLVRQIFEMRVSGNKILDIAKAVDFRCKTVSEILKNPFYCGEMYVQSQDKLYPHKYEWLISRELFDKCQKFKRKAA